MYTVIFTFDLHLYLHQPNGATNIDGGVLESFDHVCCKDNTAIFV